MKPVENQKNSGDVRHNDDIYAIDTFSVNQRSAGIYQSEFLGSNLEEVVNKLTTTYPGIQLIVIGETRVNQMTVFGLTLFIAGMPVRTAFVRGPAGNLANDVNFHNLLKDYNIKIVSLSI